ncbi:MAG TPA: FG-GAP-like repeat-containing protein [Usitatibacter sp.]|nr:FG-GAP-like repeat-containing protein [Usitatibacter sp.]
MTTWLVAPAAFAIPGDVDPAFGNAGRVLLDAGYSFREGNGVAVQADGKYVVSGQARGWGTFGSPLLRFNPDNSLDTTYGYQGEAIAFGNRTAVRVFETAAGSTAMTTENIYDPALDPRTNTLYRDVLIARYAADGFMDATFGPALDGRSQTFNVSATGSNGEQRLNAFTITPGTVTNVGGRLVAAGWAAATSNATGTTTTNLLVVRYLANGALDTAFGNQAVKGTQTFSLPGSTASFQEILGVDVDPTNGNILVVGYQGSPHKNFYALLDLKGTLKTSGTLGSFATSECNAVTRVASGRWVIACGGTSAAGVRSAYLTALNATATAVDTTFTTTSTSLGGSNDAWRALTISSADGSIYTTGTGGLGAGRLAVGAFSANGAALTGFGTGGVYLVPELVSSSGAGIAVTSTQVLATGTSGGPNSNIPVEALSLPAGTRTSVIFEKASSSTEFGAVQVMPNGTLMVGGTAGTGDTSNFITSRLNATGTLDTTYGSAGYSFVAIPNMDSFTGLTDMLVQPDGNVLVTGDFGGGVVNQSRVGAARLTAAGTGDPAFNTAGTPGYNFVNTGTGIEFTRSVRLQADGKIIAAGNGINGALGQQMAAARFNANGTRDSTYGTSGIAMTLISSATTGRALDLGPDGKAVMVGDGADALGVLQIRVARFTATGQLDATFGNLGGGNTVFTMPAGFTLLRANRVFVLSSGQIVVLASATSATGAGAMVIRFDATGRLDTTFGGGKGWAYVEPAAGAGADANFFAGTVMPNGKLVAAGYALPPGQGFLPTAVRFTADGLIDPSFGNGGISYYTDNVAFIQIFDVTAAPDGGLYLSGGYQAGTERLGLVLKTVAETAPVADLAITKTDGLANVLAGASTTYTITVTNNGPSSVTGALLTDAAATGLAKTAVACSATPGACVSAPTVAQLESGTFALPALAVGATYQITVTANVTAGSGSVSNVATIAAPIGASDPTPGNNSATDTDTVSPVADLAITKTDGIASVVTGGSTIYTITVTNNGPSSVTGAVLTDAVATGLAKTAVACSTAPGACVSAPTVAQLESGTFALPPLAAGATYQIKVTANVTAASGTSVSNVATIAAPTGILDTTPGNNSATDTDTVTAAALAITTTASPANGGTVTCTPNPVPSGGTSTCTATPAAGFTFSAFSGDCVGATCTLTNVLTAKNVTATFTSGTFAITATASPANGGTVTCTPNPVASGGTSTCTATPAVGFAFSAFSGDCVGPTCTLTNVLAAKAVTAVFVAARKVPSPDFNGDGKTDLLWQHTDGSDAVWLMNGVTPTSTPLILGPGTGWSVVHTGDFNGDGMTDLVWQHTDGSVAVWLMNGTVPISTSVILGAGTGWSVIRTGDFNGDGKTDLVWQHTDGSVAVWLMNGVAPTSTPLILGPGTGWSVIHTADFNGDGLTDLVWQHTDGSVAVWLMNGATPTSTPLILGPGTGWSVVRTGDLNGDGKTDLVWQHTDGSVALWLMNGVTPISTPLILGGGTGWSVARTADLNGDGMSDLIWQHTDGSVAVWLMNGVAPTSTPLILGPGTGWSLSSAGP